MLFEFLNHAIDEQLSYPIQRCEHDQINSKILIIHDEVCDVEDFGGDYGFGDSNEAGEFVYVVVHINGGRFVF